MNLPAAIHIDDYAFNSTGTGSLTITFGVAVPSYLGQELFVGVSSAKTLIIRVPNVAAWNSIVAGSPYTGTDTTQNWGNGFRGMGWNGSSTTGGPVNNNITLLVQYY